MERLIFADLTKGLYAYQGDKHPYDVPLTIGEIAAGFNGEYSPREIALEVFKRLYAYESNDLTPEEITRIVAERDAAISDLSGHCEYCAFRNDCAKHDNNDSQAGFTWWTDCDDWEWRGAKAVPDEQ